MATAPACALWACALVQANELNKNGELYIIRKPNLRTKIVDGTSLAAAAVLHMIPRGTTDVLLRGDATKMSSVLASALCQSEIQVPCCCCHCHHSSLIYVQIIVLLDLLMNEKNPLM
jgi:hypothetical protein